MAAQQLLAVDSVTMGRTVSPRTTTTDSPSSSDHVAGADKSVRTDAHPDSPSPSSR